MLLYNLRMKKKKKGVVAHSSGNHAQAVAFAATLLGTKSTIVMPENAPKVKVESTRGYGANIVRCQNTVESRNAVTSQIAKEQGLILIHPYDNWNIIYGAGTAAYELFLQLHEDNRQVNLDYILAPVGGGGLLSGTSLCTKSVAKSQRNLVSPNIRVIASEPENADDTFRSFVSGQIQPVSTKVTIADGLRTRIGDITFSIIKENVDDVVTVSEEEIIEALKIYFERLKLVVEPSGAVPLAALLKLRRLGKIESGKNIGIIISGGNLDMEVLFEDYRKKIVHS